MKKGSYIELKVIRTALRDTYTIGHLYIDGKYFCDTLEDKDRGLKNTMKIDIITSHKVYGQTAIPVNALSGDRVYYDVILSHSPPFQGKPSTSHVAVACRRCLVFRVSTASASTSATARKTRTGASLSDVTPSRAW